MADEQRPHSSKDEKRKSDDEDKEKQKPPSETGARPKTRPTRDSKEGKEEKKRSESGSRIMTRLKKRATELRKTFKQDPKKRDREPMEVEGRPPVEGKVAEPKAKSRSRFRASSEPPRSSPEMKSFDLSPLKRPKHRHVAPRDPTIKEWIKAEKKAEKEIEKKSRPKVKKSMPGLGLIKMRKATKSGAIVSSSSSESTPKHRGPPKPPPKVLSNKKFKDYPKHQDDWIPVKALRKMCVVSDAATEDDGTESECKSIASTQRKDPETEGDPEKTEKDTEDYDPEMEEDPKMEEE